MKILLAGTVYFALMAFICIFFKGATMLGNEYDERMEAEILLKKLKGENDKN